MKTVKFTTIAIFIAFLTACNATQVDTQSTVTLPTQFEQTAQATGSQNVQQWWQNWQDPQLNRLIEQGLQNNLDITLAQTRLKEAQANSQYAEADMGVNVGLNGSISGGISNINSGIINPSSSRSGGGYGGFSAAWEPDIFGQKRSDADAAYYTALGQQEQLYGTQLLVASQIADNYFKIFATEQQKALISQNLTVLAELQRYIQGRFNAGQATAYEVNEIAAQITALQAKQTTLTAQAVSFERNIAILLGQTPQGFHLVKQGNPLAKIPNPPAGQQPSDVINRRPDLRANAQQIRAYSAKLASAKADFLPRFDIQFLGQGGRIELNNDLSHLSGIGSFVSAGVQLPIFTNGRIEANIDAADARLKGAVIQYDKTLLTALAEVDNSYQMQQSLARQTALLTKTVQQAQKQAKDSQLLFKHGDKTLDVALRAQISALNYQEQLVQSNLSAAQNMIHLYKALGGGWYK